MKTPIFFAIVVSIASLLSICSAQVLNRSNNDIIDTNPNESQCKNDVDNNLTSICYKLSELNIKPKFKGEDITSFSHWINQNFSIPESTKDFSGKHKAITSFLILTNGQISNVTIIKGIYPPLDSALIELLSNSPNWEPGYKNGKAVNCRIEYPVFFNFK